MKKFARPNRTIYRARYSLVLWVLVLGCAAVATWAFHFRIDQTTRGTGTVIASSRLQVIQAVDGGVIRELTVKEGDQVAEGQVLARFDRTRFTAAVRELDARLAALYAEEARLRAEITGAAKVIYPEKIQKFTALTAVQTALFRERRQGIAQALSNLNAAVELAREEAKLVESLAENSDASHAEVLKARRILNQVEGEWINRKNRYYQDVQLELARVADAIGQNEQVRTQRAQQLKNSVVRAPVAGIVKNVRITTLGGVLRAGDELMQIVPIGDRLIVEAKVLPADIADIKPGLSASLRFDAFDYTIFGAVEGTVIYVSADTLKEEAARGILSYYRVHLNTAPPPVKTRTGQTVRLLPGMAAQVDIRTGQRTLMDFLLKPLKKTLAESLGEK